MTGGMAIEVGRPTCPACLTRLIRRTRLTSRTCPARPTYFC